MHRGYRDRPARRGAADVGLALALGVGAGLLATTLLNRRRGRQRRRVERYPDSAPTRTRRAPDPDATTLVGNAVTINRAPSELYAFWRDFANLPTFIENLQSIAPLAPDRWEWRFAGPGGRDFSIETEIVEDRVGESIVWRSTAGSPVAAEGEVRFREAPPGRGSIVEAVVAYRPPGGEIGRRVAELFRLAPRIQGRRELRRFKMLMETGEIATAANRRTQGD